MFLSFCVQQFEYLSYQTMNDLSLTEEEVMASQDLAPKIQLLSSLCQRLFEDSEGEDEEQERDGEIDSGNLTETKKKAQKQLYEAMVFISLSRLLQIAYLREYAADFLLQLPKVPKSCLSLLIVLALSSSKLGVKDERGGGSATVAKHNIRTESLMLLGRLVLESADESMQLMTLQQLLWYGLHDEIDLRYRMIGLVVRYVSSLLLLL